MDEVLFDDRFLSGTDITTLEFAKAMIDEGVHSMTMYFPLVVHDELLIQPTKTKNLASLGRRSGSLQGGAVPASGREPDGPQSIATLAARRLGGAE